MSASPEPPDLKSLLIFLIFLVSFSLEEITYRRLRPAGILPKSVFVRLSPFL